MDAEAWTGRSQESVTLLPLCLQMPAGATASLTRPVLCQPPAAAAAGSGSSAAAASAHADSVINNKSNQQAGQQQRAAASAGISGIVFPFLG
jgi:hypothetical protein